MPISYSCVCDAGAVVNESGDRDSVSKWGKIARALIERIEPRTRKSYEHEGNSINYIAESDRVYLAVADKAMNTRIIFAFLEKIRGRYAGENGSSFNAVLGEQMREYSNVQGTDKVAAIQSEISAVKEVMMENIAAVLRRGEKLEDMVERSENIAIEANQFKRSAVQLKQTMWWKNFKLWLIIIAVVIIIIIIIIIAVCGIDFNCKK